ncbi:MAG: LTA synthase family protein [Gemmatimonadaceae bacterium]
MQRVPSRAVVARLWTFLTATRYALVSLAVVCFLALSLATRLLLLVVDRAFASDTAADIVRALAAGTLVDTLVALWLALPLTLFLTLLPERRLHRRGTRVLLYAYAALGTFVAYFTVAAEYLFFDEFNGRFNFVAVDYLLFPTEVVTNIWESYRTGWIVAGLALLTAATVRVLRVPARRAFRHPASGRGRAILATGHMALLAVFTMGITPSLTRVSSDRALNEIAANGYYTFWMALIGDDAPYEGLYATRPESDLFGRLHRLLTEPATDTSSWTGHSVRRHVRALGPARPHNVVIVLEESFGSEFVGALKQRSDTLTPRYDSLITEGTLLAHAYSTGNRTIRALEATSSSLPPLPGVATVRRSQSDGLFTLAELLRSRGYQTEFVYGGRALFDGMGHYMLHNGMDRVVDQADYPRDVFRTAWGVADEYIFDKALTEMDAMHGRGRPFFTLVLSVSNHRPYLYPEGRVPRDPKQKQRANAVQYADYALGRFVRQARSHAWFDNTLFVLMGDHGARVYGAQELPLPSYEVPILYYAPAFVAAGRRVETLTSALDVPPTVMALLGADYESRFFGRDVFHIAPTDGRALMTHNNILALMRGGDVALLGLRGSTEVYRLDPAAQRLVRQPTPDSAGRALIEDAIAYFDGADQLYRSGEQRFPTGRVKAP